MALGSTLALLYLRGARKPLLGAIHGIMGAAGFVFLLVALEGPRRGDAMGVGSFGADAAVLFGIALVLGLCLWLLLLFKRTQRIAGVVIAAHASLAITAFVLFLAWTSIG